MAYTDWRSLGSNHTIADTPATGFQYRYSVNDDFDYFTLRDGGSIITDRWNVTISAPDGTVIFQQQVAIRYLLTYMGSGALLIIFVWYISSETITTTVPEDPPTLAGDEGYAVPAGGSDFTALAGKIMFDWYSPVYEIPLPAGAIFDVTFHTAGTPALSQAEAAVQTRVLAGGGMTGTRMTEDGMVRLVRPRQGGGLEFISGCDVRGLGAVGESAWPVSTTDAPSEPQVSSLVSSRAAATHGIAFYLHQVMPVVIYQESGNLMAVRSSDDGRTWGEAMEIVSGVTMTAAEIGPDGGTISVVGMRPNFVVAALSDDHWTAASISNAIEYRLLNGEEWPASAWQVFAAAGWTDEQWKLFTTENEKTAPLFADTRASVPVALVCSFERDADNDGQPILRKTDEFAAQGLPSLPLSLQFMKIQNNVYHLIIDNSGCLRYYRSSDGMRSWQ